MVIASLEAWREVETPTVTPTVIRIITLCSLVKTLALSNEVNKLIAAIWFWSSSPVFGFTVLLKTLSGSDYPIKTDLESTLFVFCSVYSILL